MPVSIPIPDKHSFRPDEVAKLFQLSTKTIYLWIEIGQLEAVRVGGTLRVPRQALLDIQKPALEE